MSKVHQYFSFPFMASSDIHHLPISYHGFSFVSISWLNDTSAVSGVLHNLNHHVPLFYKMAQIMIADWQCSLSQCVFPFSSFGLEHSFHLSCIPIPMLFLLAHHVLCVLKLNILPSDQSFILNGVVSLLHLAKQVPNSLISSLRCYLNMPFQFLCAWGSWHTRVFLQWSLSSFLFNVPFHFLFSLLNITTSISSKLGCQALILSY